MIRPEKDLTSPPGQWVNPDFGKVPQIVFNNPSYSAWLAAQQHLNITIVVKIQLDNIR